MTIKIPSLLLKEIDSEQANLKNSLRMWTDAYEYSRDLLELAEENICHYKKQLEKLEEKKRYLTRLRLTAK